MIWYHNTHTHVLIITRINQSQDFIQTYNEYTTIKHKTPTQPNSLTNRSIGVEVCPEKTYNKKNTGCSEIFPFPIFANHHTVLPGCIRLTLPVQQFTTQVASVAARSDYHQQMLTLYIKISRSMSGIILRNWRSWTFDKR